MPEKSPLSPAIHNITFCGTTGAIFVLLTAALVLYIEAFVSTAWLEKAGDPKENNCTTYEGLWQATYLVKKELNQGWFTTSQVLITIGFIGVILSFGLATIYMTANRASKNTTLTTLAFVSFVSVVFIVIGVSVVGYHKGSYSVSSSFIVTCIAAVLTFFAGLLTIRQIRRSNVRLC